MNNVVTQKILLDYQMPVTVQFRRWNKWYLNSKKSLQGNALTDITNAVIDNVVAAPLVAITAGLIIVSISLVRA
mgnify:FL=1